MMMPKISLNATTTRAWRSRLPKAVQARPFSSSSTEKGIIADNKPVKFSATGGKTYFWCACGHSQKQPLCDGSHKKPEISLRPIKWQCTESRDYWLCNCKQTAKGPFCDATHKKPEIQQQFAKQQQNKE